MRRLARDPLWRAVRLLEVDGRRFVAAVLAGAGSLGSAVALAAVSAWLIARAAQMPSVAVLSVAAVAVRTFGISRGLLRYLERLVSHDVALRGMATLRARLYEGLASGSSTTLVRLRRGDLLARVGADVDAVGDVVVRGVLPIAVAAVVALGSSAAMALFLPGAGVALAGCLALAGVAAPWWSVRAARTVERRQAAARADVAAAVQTLVDGAAELRVAGRLGRHTGALAVAERELARATDAGARSAAVAAALGPAATGLAVLAALLLGAPAVVAGTLAPVELAVVALTPLAVFEATSLVPGAVVALLRSREAARRVVELLDPPAEGVAAPQVGTRPPGPTDGEPLLRATDLACGWPGGPVLLRLPDLELRPGRSVAVVGPSGLGKTTLLLTLAGLLPARSGSVTVDGTPVDRLTREVVAARVTMTAEDAHVFDTTVLENLRVARGDVTPDDATHVLGRVGLGPWLAGLPDGLGTVLGSDAARLSGGERRRVLLARALLSPSAVLLLDEPTEHVDAGSGDLLAGLLDGSLTDGRAVVVVTHRLAGLEGADEVIVLDRAGSVRARGPHRALLTGALADPAYRVAWDAEQLEAR